MHRDYQNKDVNFFYVYKTLAHPEINGYVSPTSLEERLKHIAEFKENTKSQIPWICDSMDNAMKSAFETAPNGEFILDPEGKIIRKRFWSNPRTLRADLEELVGKADTVTSPDEVLVEFTPPKREVASGVVKRLAIPGRMMPVIVKAKQSGEESEHPLYAKLRVEAGGSVIDGKEEGQVYFGLYLDPLYKVHWNNRAGKISIEVETPEGVTMNQASFQGPDVKEDADIDPRQFLAKVNRNEIDGPFHVTVKYVVCDDAETFCYKISQQYEVEFTPNRAAGSRPGVFMPAMFAKVAELDTNADGKVAGDEFPENMATLYLSHMDRNDDDEIDSREIELFMAMYNEGRGFASDKNDGQR